MTVAGRAQPVGTYEVATSETATAEPVAPFVGRDAELRRVCVAAFDRARAERAGRARDGARARPGSARPACRASCAAARRRRDATTFEIRCDRAGGSTFAPIARPRPRRRRPRGRRGDDDGAAPASASARCSRATTATATASSTCSPAWSAPRRPDRSRRRSGRSGALVESLAAERPLVVVIDDIQWAEPKLLDLLEHLAEWVTDAPVLLVVPRPPRAARAAAGARRARPARRRRASRSTVSTRGATEALAAGLLGTDAARASWSSGCPRRPTATRCSCASSCACSSTTA